MSESPEILDRYRSYLGQVGKSAHTVRAYTQDVSGFVQWFEGTTGEAFDPRAVDSREIQAYRQHLLTVKGFKPATVNRRLIALRRFFAWAKKGGWVKESPFEVLETVLVKEQKDTAPRWLNHKEQLALLRAVRKSGPPRDLAIIQTLLGTGLRISELAALTVADIELSERKGILRVRGGKGSKARVIPLDKRTRRALARYLEERPEADSERLFIGQRGRKSLSALVREMVQKGLEEEGEDWVTRTRRVTRALLEARGGKPIPFDAVELVRSMREERADALAPWTNAHRD